MAATVAGWVFSETDAEREFGEQGVNERLMPPKRRERKQDSGKGRTVRQANLVGSAGPQAPTLLSHRMLCPAWEGVTAAVADPRELTAGGCLLSLLQLGSEFPEKRRHISVSTTTS